MSAFLRPHTIIYIALLASVAQADVLHLNNGRQLEGEVIGKGKRAIHLRVRGGVIHVPKASVRSIEKKLTASQEYAARARKTDMNDRRAVEELAHWASRRGLGEAAKSLRKLALDHHLEEKVKAARSARSGRAFLETYRWAKNRSFSDEVLRYLLDEARALAPELELPAPPPEAPQHPASDEQPAPSRSASRQRKPASPPAPSAPTTREAELAKRLAEQKRQSAELEKRLRALEDARRQEQAAREQELRAARLRRRRVRRRGPVGLYIGPFRVVNKPCPTPTEPAPAPCKPRRR